MTEQPSLCHFIAATIAFYERDGGIQQRHMNVLLETPTAQVTKEHLSEIQRGSLASLHAENGVEPKDVQDVVIVGGPTLLGVMPQHVFHGTEAPAEPAEAEQKALDS